MILRTFHSVFPEVEVWWLDRDTTSSSSDRRRRSRGPARASRRLLDGPFAAERRRAMRLGTSPGVLEPATSSARRSVAAFAGEGPRHTDDRPLLEFEAPRDLYGPPGLERPAPPGREDRHGRPRPRRACPPRRRPSPCGSASPRCATWPHRPRRRGSGPRAGPRLRPAALGLVRDAAAALDAGGRGQRPSRSSTWPTPRLSPASPTRARARPGARARLLTLRGDLAAATGTLEAVDELEGPAGRRDSRARPSRAGDTDRAFSLAARLLAAGPPRGSRRTRRGLGRSGSCLPAARAARPGPRARARPGLSSGLRGIRRGRRAPSRRRLAAEAAGLPADAARRVRPRRGGRVS